MHDTRTNLVRQVKTSDVIQFSQYNLTTLDKTIGQILYAARKKVQGLTQEALAKAAGISKPYVGTIENMRPHPDSGALPRPEKDKIIGIVNALNSRLPKDDQLDLDRILLMAGHAPKTNGLLDKPQNVKQFYDRLEQMGFKNQFTFVAGQLEQLDADDLQEVLDVIDSLVITKLKRRRIVEPILRTPQPSPNLNE